MSWASRAACVGHAHLFFCNHYEVEPQRIRREAKAVAICETCPVIAECREEGRGEEFGVWGGLTPRERKRWRRKPKGIERVA